jgi:uncharacterized membrane protein
MSRGDVLDMSLRKVAPSMSQWLRALLGVLGVLLLAMIIAYVLLGFDGGSSAPVGGPSNPEVSQSASPVPPTP